MEPVYFLPSEIARLVLGYLKQENCVKAYKALLKESSHLGEYSALLKQGREYPTTVAGKNLTEMLQEYGHIKLRETRALKCGQPTTALWKQFDELVKVIKQQVSPKQLQQPRSKLRRPRLCDRIITTGISAGPLPEVVSRRVSSDVEDRQSANGSALAPTACNSVQTTATCIGVQKLPKNLQKIPCTSQLTVEKSNQADETSEITYLLSEGGGQPVCPGSCGFDQLQGDIEDLSESETGEITKAPTSVQDGSSAFGANLEFNSIEKRNNVSDTCILKPPQIHQSEVQSEEEGMLTAEDETEKAPQSPMSVCQPVSQCENAIDSFEQAKALHSPSVGGNQVPTAWQGVTRLSESAFSSIGHMSGIGATTPVKEASFSEHGHVTPSKSCSFLTAESTKGKSPRRKRFAPKRRSSGGAGIRAVGTSGLPGPGVGNVARGVEGIGAHKSGQGEESLTCISHHEDSMDIPSLVEQLLENTELQQKLAENINRGRYMLSCDPAGQKPEGQPQERVVPVTPRKEDKPPATPRNTSIHSLEDILDIHEAQMSDVEMNGIINMTRSDPAFDALFQLFDNENEQDDKGTGDSTLSFSSQIRMAFEADGDQQQMETDMAAATLVQLSEPPSVSNCESVKSNSRANSYQRMLSSGQFCESVQNQIERGQEINSEEAEGNRPSVSSDTKECHQQTRSGCHANQASNTHVGVGNAQKDTFSAVSESGQICDKIVKIVSDVQNGDFSCTDQMNRAKIRDTGQNIGGRKASVCAASQADTSPEVARSGCQNVRGERKSNLLSDIRPCLNRTWIDASKLELNGSSAGQHLSSSPADSPHSPLPDPTANDYTPSCSTRARKAPQKVKIPLKSAKVQINTSCDPVMVLAENSRARNTTKDMTRGSKMSNYQKDTNRSSKVSTADGKPGAKQKKEKAQSLKERSKSKIPSQGKVNVSNTSECVQLSDDLPPDSSSDLGQGHHCPVSRDPMLSSTPKRSSQKVGRSRSHGCSGLVSTAQGSPRSESDNHSPVLAAKTVSAGSEQNASGCLRTPTITQSSSVVSPGLSALLQIASTLPEREAVNQGKVVTTIVQTPQGEVCGEFIVTHIRDLEDGSLGAEDRPSLLSERVRDDDEQSTLLSSKTGPANTMVPSTSNMQGVSSTVLKVHQTKDKTEVPVSIPSHYFIKTPAESGCMKRSSTDAIPLAQTSEETNRKDLSEENTNKQTPEEPHSCRSNPSEMEDGSKNSRSQCSVKRVSGTKQNKSCALKQDASCSSVSEPLLRRSPRLADKSSLASPRHSASTPVKQLDVSSPYFVSPATGLCERQTNPGSDLPSDRDRERVAAFFTPEKVSTTSAGRKLRSLDLNCPNNIIAPEKVSNTATGGKLANLDSDSPSNKTIAQEKVSTTLTGGKLPNLDSDSPSNKTITPEKVSTTVTGGKLPNLDSHSPSNKTIPPEKVSTTVTGGKLPNLDRNSPSNKTIPPEKVSTTDEGGELTNLEGNTPSQKAVLAEKVLTSDTGGNILNSDLDTSSNKMISPEKLSTSTVTKFPDLNTSSQTGRNVGSGKNTLKITMKQQPRMRNSRIQAVSVECLNKSSLNVSSKRKSGRQPRKVNLKVAPSPPTSALIVHQPVESLASPGVSAFPVFSLVTTNYAVPLTHNSLRQGTQPLTKLSMPPSRISSSHRENVGPVLLACSSSGIEIRTTPGKTQDLASNRIAQAHNSSATASAGRVANPCDQPSASETVNTCKAALSAKLKKRQLHAAASAVLGQQRPSMGGDAHSDLTTIDWTQFNEDKPARIPSRGVPENKRQRKKRGVGEQAVIQGAEKKKSKMDVDLSKLEIEKLLSFVHKT